MNQLNTRGIILARTNFGEADRILTVLTPDYGKLRLMAKGVRRVKSKLAGGIELFSVSDLTFIRGKSDINTLVSTRLKKHYASIVKDIDRTMLGYELMKILDRATEDETEAEYFNLLEDTFEALDNPVIDSKVIQCWFSAQLLELSGHAPNLQTDALNVPLKADQSYNFDFERMSFISGKRGRYLAAQIKYLRLLFSGSTPAGLQKVQGSDRLAQELLPLIQTMLKSYIRI